MVAENATTGLLYQESNDEACNQWPYEACVVFKHNSRIFKIALILDVALENKPVIPSRIIAPFFSFFFNLFMKSFVVNKLVSRVYVQDFKIC